VTGHLYGVRLWNGINWHRKAPNGGLLCAEWYNTWCQNGENILRRIVVW